MEIGTLLKDMMQHIATSDFGEYFQQYTQLSKKHFKLADLDISPREFYLWKSKGLSPLADKNTVEEDKREWVRLDFTQYIWLMMVKTLRGFGYSFENIKQCKDSLFNQTELSVKANTGKDNTAVIDNLYQYFAKDTLPKELKGIMHAVIASPEFQTQVEGLFTKRRPMLEIIIFEAISHKNTEVGVGFFENGECQPFNWDMFLNIEQWQDSISKEYVISSTMRRPHIYISITKYIADFIVADEKTGGELSCVILSASEQELLRQFRSNEYKTITINYDKGMNTKIIKTEKEKRVKEAEIANYIQNIIFAPHSKTTFTRTNNGDLIINSVKTKKLNK